MILPASFIAAHEAVLLAADMAPIPSECEARIFRCDDCGQLAIEFKIAPQDDSLDFGSIGESHDAFLCANTVLTEYTRQLERHQRGEPAIVPSEYEPRIFDLAGRVVEWRRTRE